MTLANPVKLSLRKAREIRRKFWGKVATYAELAAQYRVTTGHISHVICERAWADTNPPNYLVAPRVPVTRKRCRKCRLEKALEQFTFCTALHDRRRSECKPCVNLLQRQRRNSPRSRGARTGWSWLSSKQMQWGSA